MSNVLRAMFHTRPVSRFMIGGHRGVGENLWIEGTPSTAGSSAVVPEYRENTIKSFLRALDHGVNFVEFDVQVTSDGVPVLWHDDKIVQEATATEMEVKDMPLSEFTQLVARQNIALSSNRLARHFRGVRSRKDVPEPVLPWACTYEDALPTLAEVFAAVPAHCGFDIEIKMTQGDDVARTPREEVDRVVDAIWGVVQGAGGAQGSGSNPDQADASLVTLSGAPSVTQRNIFFSSFDPDVCAAIRKKQSQYDVWYVSGCGLYTHVDPRRTSIPAALQFAKEHQLSGVVLPATVLLANEGMVQQAAELGLLLMTYGLENDDEAAVARQRELGVCGAIVDNVQAMAPQQGMAH